METKTQIRPIDYAVLISVLLISIIIGFYHGFRDKLSSLLRKTKKQSSNDAVELNLMNEGENRKTSEYLMANSTMGTVPVTFSLLASFYSATALLGIPGEVYQYGAQFLMTAFGHGFVPLIGAFITGPFFSSHNVSSVFEYFELRFDSKHVRLVGSICYLIRNSISSAIFMYGPATSLALLAGLDEKICIGLLGVIGTAYTTIGGIRGVIWNDLFQALVMFLSLLIIITKGVYDAGGVVTLWETNLSGGRLNFFNFDPDPFIRQSFWSLIFGQAIYMSMSFCFDQQMIQRFQASRTKKIAKRALILNCPGVFIMVSLCCFVGLILYANFAGCDPLTHRDPSKRIGNPNQLVGYFVVNNLRSYPGAAGIFLASIFCGSLSSVSSYLNSQAAIIWHDLLLPFEFFRSFDDFKSLTINKLLVLICGCIGTGLAFIISTLGGSLTQISNSLNGAFNAPIMGLFLLGMLFSVSTARGAIIGTVAGFAAALWISLGAYTTKPVYPMLNVTTEFCLSNYSTGVSVISNRTVIMASELTGINKFYSLSYLWFMPFGILVTIVVGLIASIIDGCLIKKDRIDKRDYIYFDLCFR